MTTTTHADGAPYTAAIDPTDSSFYDDPYPVYDRLRREAPVHLHPNGMWMLFRYEDVMKAMRDDALSRREEHALDAPRNRIIIEETGVEYLTRPALTKMDKPEHTQLRRLLSSPFTPRGVESLRPRVDELVHEMLGSLDPGTEIELVEQIARPLPAQIFFDMVGFPRTDRPEIYEWAEMAINLSDPFLTREQYRDYTAASGQLYGFMHEMVEHKRDNLDDDLMSFLIRAGDGGEVIGPDQVAGNLLLLFLAGHHTTVNAFGNAIYALLTHRDQWELLVREPGLLNNAVEELLRYDNTAQCMPRVVPADYEIGGVTIPAGVHLLSWLASANRDEAKYGPTAGELDITRPDADRSAAFGFGAHLCLGAALARLEMQSVLGALAARFPNVELVTETPKWQRSAFLRGVETLRLRL